MASEACFGAVTEGVHLILSSLPEGGTGITTPLLAPSLRELSSKARLREFCLSPDKKLLPSRLRRATSLFRVPAKILR